MNNVLEKIENDTSLPSIESDTMSEVKLARKYLSAADRANKRGIDFNLSFAKYKRLLVIKRCQLTNILLTSPDSNGIPKDTDRSIDRIDHTKAYSDDNVMVTCRSINLFKERLFENRDIKNKITLKHIKKLIGILEKRNILV